jgi:hypothetical protein
MKEARQAFSKIHSLFGATSLMKALGFSISRSEMRSLHDPNCLELGQVDYARL